MVSKTSVRQIFSVATTRLEDVVEILTYTGNTYTIVKTDKTKLVSIFTNESRDVLDKDHLVNIMVRSTNEEFSTFLASWDVVSIHHNIVIGESVRFLAVHDQVSLTHFQTSFVIDVIHNGKSIREKLSL